MALVSWAVGRAKAESDLKVSSNWFPSAANMSLESVGIPPTEGLSVQRTGGVQRLQPVFCIVCQASIALCRSIRLRVIGSGGRGGT